MANAIREDAERVRLYHEDLKSRVASGERDASTRYEHLAIADTQAAADVFEPVYEPTWKNQPWAGREQSGIPPDTMNQSVAEKAWELLDQSVTDLGDKPGGKGTAL
jgi:hypothetical protein